MSTSPLNVTIHDTAALGAQLRVHREQLRLTQATAAALSGVSTRLWSECETGKRTHVAFETVIRMLNTVGVDLAISSRRNAIAE